MANALDLMLATGPERAQKGITAGIDKYKSNQLASFRFNQMRDEAKRKASARTQLGEFVGGSLGNIASQDPGMAQKALSMKSTQQDMAQKQKKFTHDELAYQLDIFMGKAESLKTNLTPEGYEDAKASYEKIVPGGTANWPPIEQVTPELIEQAQQSLMGYKQQMAQRKTDFDRKSALAKEKRAEAGEDRAASGEKRAEEKWRMTKAGTLPGKEPTPTELAKLISEQSKYPKGSKKWLNYEQAIKKKGSSKGMSITMPNGTIVSFGGPNDRQKLARPVLKALQNDVINAASNLEDLDSIADVFSEDYLTATGKAKKMGISWIDFLFGPSNLTSGQKEFLAGHTKFSQKVEQVFNIYRKEITGAAAAVQELKDLKKTMLNTSLSPTEFRASFDNFKETLKRTLRLKRKLLREGLNLSDNNGEKLAFEIRNGEDDRMPDRAYELKRDGLSIEQIQVVLFEEGYLKKKATQ